MSDEAEPWPIANAIAGLKELRDRAEAHSHSDDVDPAEAGKQVVIVKAMDYAIEVVKSINRLRPPVPPSPEDMAEKAVREFCKELGCLFKNLGGAFGDIASGDFPENWDPWKQRWREGG